MKTQWQILLLLLVPSLAAPALADTSEMPLTWQKVNLEEKLLQKINHNLEGILPNKNYVTNVTITLKPKPQKSVQNGLEEKKPDENLAAKAQAKNVKASNEDDRPDFGKLDLDPALVETAAPENASPQTVADLEARLAQPIADNVFDYIEKVKVLIVLDAEVQDSKRKLIEKVVSEVIDKVGEKAPDISIEKAELVVKPKPPEPWDLTRWALELKLPLTLAALTLLTLFFAAIFIVFLFSGYKKIEARRVSVLESQNSREEAVAARAAEASEAASDFGDKKEAGQGNDAEIKQKGFERLQALLREDTGRVANLVQEWIRAPGRGAAEALTALPRIFSTEDLASIFKSLGQEDRKEWKKFISQPIDAAGLKLAEDFVSEQIVENLFTGGPKIEPELREKLQSLKLTDCLEIARQNPQLAAVLVNVLPTSQVGKLLALLEDNIASKVTNLSLKLSYDDISKQSSALSRSIDAIKAGTTEKNAPFAERAVDLIKSLSPEKEKSFFASLADNGEYSVLEEAARRCFPAELVMSLPVKLLKTCMDRYPSAKRYEMIYSRPNELRESLLEVYGKTGAKSREILDLALMDIENDEVRKRRAMKQKEQLWKDFVEVLRGVLRGNEAAAQQSEGVLEEWIAKKTGKVSSFTDAGTEVAGNLGNRGGNNAVA